MQEIGKGTAGLDQSGVNISRVEASAKASNSNNQYGDSSSYNQSSSSQQYNQFGGNVQAGSSQQLYSSGRGARRPSYNQQSESQSGGGPNRSGPWWYKRNVCFQCGRYGHYAKECRDGTSVKAVEVKSDDGVSCNKLQVSDGDDEMLHMYKLQVLPEKADEQVVTLNRLKVEPSGTDGAQSSGSFGVNGGNQRLFSQWCEQRVPVSGARNFRRRFGKSGKCWRCGKSGHHKAECWTRRPQQQPGYVGRGRQRKQSTALTDERDCGVTVKYVHDSGTRQDKVQPIPAKRTMVPSNKVEDVRLEDGLLGGKSPQQCDRCGGDKLQADFNYEPAAEEKLLAFKQENEAEKKHFYDFYGDKLQVDYENAPWRRSLQV